MFDTWWNSLNLPLQVFYAMGILSLVALLIQMALSVFGGMDQDYSPGEMDHGSGLSFFSIRGVTAFFTGFGWTGAIVMKAGGGITAAIAAGTLTGGVLMFTIYFLMRSMLRLQSNGALDFNNAIGRTGTVYVTIPPGQRAGGQVELLLQGRLTMAEALQKGDQPLRPGDKVTVVSKIGHSTLIVEPLS